MPFALLDQAEQNASPGKVGYFLRIPSPFFMAYARRYLRFPSQILGREMEMLHFGHHGYPLICLPTSNGRFFDVEDRGIIASLSHHLEQGYLQAFCVETLDWETFFNRQLDLPQRRDRWLLLEQHWVEELIPYAKAEAQNEFLVVAGFSLGATHAVNLTCRHPGLVRRCLALGGALRCGRSRLCHRLGSPTGRAGAVFHQPAGLYVQHEPATLGSLGRAQHRAEVAHRSPRPLPQRQSAPGRSAQPQRHPPSTGGMGGGSRLAHLASANPRLRVGSLAGNSF